MKKNIQFKISNHIESLIADIYLFEILQTVNNSMDEANITQEQKDAIRGKLKPEVDKIAIQIREIKSWIVALRDDATQKR